MPNRPTADPADLDDGFFPIMILRVMQRGVMPSLSGLDQLKRYASTDLDAFEAHVAGAKDAIRQAVRELGERVALGDAAQTALIRGLEEHVDDELFDLRDALKSAAVAAAEAFEDRHAALEQSYWRGRRW